MDAGVQVMSPFSALALFGLAAARVPFCRFPLAVLRCPAPVLLAAASQALLFPSSLFAQQVGASQLMPGAQERQLFGTGSSSGGGLGSGSSGLDINNPIDLINRIRRSTALEDATPPSSAVDQALRELEAPPVQGGAGSAAAPKPAAVAAPQPASSVAAPRSTP
jgi:hypothetical protein